MKSDAAVSPVIGAILMIVLTLIVAAVVSSFAGGLVETKGKCPVMRLEAEFQQTEGLFLTHLAGDPMPLSQISLRLTPSQTFGSDAIKHSRKVEKTYFQDRNGKKWGEITVMQVGDRHVIPNTDIILALDDGVDLAYQVAVPASAGKTFYLEIYYENTLIAKPEVLIKA